MVSRTWRWRGLGVACSVVLAGGLCPSLGARADLPSELEPDYAEAVIAYNSQNYDRTIALLTELQKKAPKQVEFLELKAIALKAAKRTGEAANVYRDLVQQKVQEGKDKKEIAPYAFELGVIRFNEKKYDQAEQYLAYSLKQGFNPEISNLYLGMTRMQKSDWVRAEQDFKNVVKSDLDEVKPAAHLYLAQVYFKLEDPADGFDHLLKAKGVSQKFIDREDASADSKQMAEQVRAAAEGALAPFDKTQFFGNFSFLTGYDSNALLTPDSTDSAASGTSQSTLKSMLSVGGGYASSPMREFQFVPSLRLNFNKNFNQDTYGTEFEDSTLALYITRNVFAAFSYGLKTEAIAVFQNDYNSSTEKSKYRLYDKQLTFAPYAKWEANKLWTLGLEAGLKKISYNGEDDVTESLRRSGNTWYAKATAQNKAHRRFWNPTYTLKFEANGAEGTEYESTAIGAVVGNAFKWKDIDWFQSLEYTHTGYGESSQDRTDSFFMLSLYASKKIGPRWSVVGSADYTKNSSTVEDSYSYNRFNLLAGVGYTF